MMESLEVGRWGGGGSGPEGSVHQEALPCLPQGSVQVPLVGMNTLIVPQLFMFVCVMLHGPLGEKHQLGRLSSYWNTTKNSEFSGEFFLSVDQQKSGPEEFPSTHAF